MAIVSLHRLGYGLVALAVCVLLVIPQGAGSAAIPAPAGTGALPALTCIPAWQVVPSPHYGTGGERLTGLAAISATDVWAVGYYTDTAGLQTLALHWDGSAWSRVSTPSPGTGNQLTAVTAFASNDVWAVGNYVHSSPLLLVIHWNGTTWQQQTNPSPGYNYANWLNGVGGTSSSDLWTVGFYRNYSPAGLFMHWDGTQWTVTSSLTAPLTDLKGVTAVAPDNVWTVGGSWGNQAPSVIYHYTAGAWQLSPSPDMHLLYGIAAHSATDLWAVGDNGILHGDGTAWQVASTAFLNLRGVAAPAGDDAWAVGAAIAHWDGAAWTGVPAASPGLLSGVAALGATDVWAVGTDSVSPAGRSLIEHYSTDCPSSTATVTPLTTPTPCPCTPTPTAGRTVTPTATAAGATGTPPPTATLVPPTGTPPAATATPPAATNTPARATATPAPPSPTPAEATATGTPCTLGFSDVHPSDYFYGPVLWLACHGVLSGYGDGSFRPYANATRGQTAKIVVLTAGWPLLTPSAPTFTDMPVGSPFFSFVETAYRHGILAGYADGTFRPGLNVTRGQLCKLVVGAAGWPLVLPAHPTFADVRAGSPFFAFIETAVQHGVVSGYGDGTFRPGNPATRGQIAKIVYRALATP